MTWLTVAVFVAVYLAMALGRLPGLRLDRTGFALLGAIVLYVGGVVDGPAAQAAIDYPTLIVLFGLMLLSAQYAACGFYGWCSAKIARTPASPQKLLGLTILVAGGLSAALANDVVVFAMTPLLCTGLLRRGLDPRPFVIALAAGANAGSAATLIGNPQNILIGQAGGLDFWRFLAVCGPPALAAMLIAYGVIAWQWRKAWDLPGEHDPTSHAMPVVDRAGLRKAVLYTILLVVMFTAPLPHVEGVLLVASGLLVSRTLATRRMLGLVDWHLLVLFAGLFIVTAALGETGLPAAALEALGARGFDAMHLSFLAPLTIVGSNTIGNVPLTILILAILPDPSPATLYALALISTLAGNLLLTGSLANIIAVERAHEIGVEVGFGLHARSGIPLTLLSLAAALAWLVWGPTGL